MDKWDLFFMQVVGWALHPGYLKNNRKDQPTMQDCARMADDMLELSEAREHTQPWHGSEQ